MKKYNIFSRLRHRITIPLFVFVLAVVSTIALWNYQNMRNTMKNNALINNANAALQMKEMLDIIFRECLVMNSYISIDSEVKDYMYCENSTELRRGGYPDIVRMTSEFTYVKEYIYDVGVYSFDTSTMYSSRQRGTDLPMNEEVYGDSLMRNRVEQMQENENTIFYHWYGEKYPYVMSFIRCDENGKGVTFLTVNMIELGNFMPDNDKVKYYIIAQDGTIVYSSEIQEMGQSFKTHDTLVWWKGEEQPEIITSRDGTGIILSGIKSEAFNWYYVAVGNEEALAVTDELLFFWLMMLVFTGVGILLAYFVSQRAYAPIERLVRMVEGNEQLSIDSFSAVETRTIVRNLTLLLSENEALRNNLEKSVKDFNIMQNTALQYQINPHFLFNTLNQINSYIIRTNGAKHESVKLVVWLSTILHYSLDTENRVVTLEEELDKTDIYMKIMEKRLGSNYRIIYHVPEELRGQKIIKLTLQPLIENAIYHGLQPCDGGLIEVESYVEDGGLYVCVKDNGIGMKKEDVEQLREKLEKNITTSEHIGLNNVQSRIRLLYGKPYGIQVEERRDEQGMVVKMALPYWEK